MVTSSTAGDEQLTESVEELRERLEAMKRMMERDSDNEERGRKRNPPCKASVINGDVLSFVFILVLVLIIGVSFHSFQNLYYAVLKKFHPREHTEL